MSLTGTEGIKHCCVRVEMQTLFGQQSTTAEVGNEVREKSSVSAKKEKNREKLDKRGEQKVIGTLHMM